MREVAQLTGAVLTSLHATDGGDHQALRVEALVSKDAPYAVQMTATLNVDVDNLYASHSSHASHASHASHYSGSGGYSYPAPYTAPPTPAPSYPQPSTYAPSNTLAPSGNLGGTSTGSSNTPDALQILVMRVQVALYAAGYDPGAVDGILSEPTRQALRKYQAARGLAVTGRMTTETLNALGVAIPR